MQRRHRTVRPRRRRRGAVEVSFELEDEECVFDLHLELEMAVRSRR